MAKYYRCLHGNCMKISSNNMITKYNGECYRCGFRKFSGLGKYSTWEAIIVLIRDWFSERHLKREKKKC